MKAEINPTLENLQKIVGGYIEIVPNRYTDAIMYCNEEGKLEDLESNFFIFENDTDDDCIDVILGPVIMFGPYVNDSETDLTEELFNKTLKCIEDF